MDEKKRIKKEKMRLIRESQKEKRQKENERRRKLRESESNVIMFGKNLVDNRIENAAESEKCQYILRDSKNIAYADTRSYKRKQNQSSNAIDKVPAHTHTVIESGSVISTNLIDSATSCETSSPTFPRQKLCGKNSANLHRGLALKLKSSRKREQKLRRDVKKLNAIIKKKIK